MNAMQNILAGVQQQAQAREQAERKADIQNEQEKAEIEQVQPEEMTTAQMTEAIQTLSAIVLDMKKQSEGKGE